jgi:hypothetical protein
VIAPADPGATFRHMAAHSFSVVFEDAGDGWVYAHAPELPEVHTQGQNLDDAYCRSASRHSAYA